MNAPLPKHRVAILGSCVTRDLFTHVPEIKDGHLIVPDTPGWGTEPNEAAIRARPPKAGGGLLNYGQKQS